MLGREDNGNLYTISTTADTQNRCIEKLQEINWEISITALLVFFLNFFIFLIFPQSAYVLFMFHKQTSFNVKIT